MKTNQQAETKTAHTPGPWMAKRMPGPGREEWCVFNRDGEIVAVGLLEANARKNRVISWNLVSIGSITASIVHPREVLRATLVSGGCSFALLHNHPSGDPAPSSADLRVTHLIREASKVVEVSFIDHVIVGRASCDPLGKGHYSFREAGLL